VFQSEKRPGYCSPGRLSGEDLQTPLHQFGGRLAHFWRQRQMQAFAKLESVSALSNKLRPDSS